MKAYLDENRAANIEYPKNMFDEKNNQLHSRNNKLNNIFYDLKFSIKRIKNRQIQSFNDQEQLQEQEDS